MQGGTAGATATATGGGFGNGGALANFGTGNATSFAATVNGYIATAQSVAAGSSGQAQATAQTNFFAVNTVQTGTMSQVGGTGPANALAQVGSGTSLPSTITAGQSFSAAIPFIAGPLITALGSMGAGGTGPSSLAYSQSTSFTFNTVGTPFLIGFLGSTSLGTGFDSALFQIFDNGNLIINKSFVDLASAQAYFFDKLIDIQLAAGLHNI
jgi:hypothetical protein